MTPSGPGWGGTYVKYTMLEVIEKLHLDVEILTEHAARHLLTDDNGAITGVIADDPGGQTQVNAPVVILATGGFGKSDEKLREFAPWFFEGETPIHRFSVPTDTGDGIDMLRELGVEPDPQRMFVSCFGPKHHPFNNVLADMALEPEAIQVNLDGQRWVDEALHLHGMTPWHQPTAQGNLLGPSAAGTTGRPSRTISEQSRHGYAAGSLRPGGRPGRKNPS